MCTVFVQQYFAYTDHRKIVFILSNNYNNTTYLGHVNFFFAKLYILIYTTFYVKIEFCQISHILQLHGSVLCSSDGDPLISRKRLLNHISGGLDSILILIKHFLSVLKISKTFIFFLKTSSEYLTRYGQGSVLRSVFKDPL